MRAILMSLVRDKVTRQCPQTTTFEEKARAEADSNRGPSAASSLKPYRQAKPAHTAANTRRGQRTSFDTLDVRAIKLPPSQN